MKFLVVPDIDGQYVNPEGEHFNVIYGGFVRGPRASEFKEFDTLKHALEYYNLIDPNAPVEEEKEEEQPAEEVVISETENTTEEQPTVSEMENVEEIIVYKKEASPAGTYQDKEGERYNILSQSFEEVPEGWTAFENEEEAAAAWDLTPIDEE